jgi:hypothetical protein
VMWLRNSSTRRLLSVLALSNMRRTMGLPEFLGLVARTRRVVRGVPPEGVR